MFWRKSRPARADSEQRLREAILGYFRNTSPNQAYSLSQLAGEFRLRELGPLVIVLAELSMNHQIDQVFRVESPSNLGGIADFPTLESIPRVIFDWHRDRNIEVERQMLRVLFKKHEQH
jgi:hypothetical protein